MGFVFCLLVWIRLESDRQRRDVRRQRRRHEDRRQTESRNRLSRIRRLSTSESNPQSI